MRGRQHGPGKTWYPGGELARVEHYKDDLVDGPIESWYEDGTPKTSGRCISGRRHGVFREWHEDGRLHVEKNYVRGELDGPYSEWTSDGFQQEYTYIYGRLCGPYKVCNAKGVCVKRGAYVVENGKSVQRPAKIESCERKTLK